MSRYHNSIPKPNDIVPLYNDSKNFINFKGMALLIKQDTSQPPSYHIIEEQEPTIRNKVKKFWARDGKGGWVINCYRSQSDTEYFITDQNGKNIRVSIYSTRPYLQTGSEIIVKNKNYIVINDDGKFTELCTQRDFASGNIECTIIKNKPFKYRLGGYEPRSTVFETTRWLVDILPNPTYSEVSNDNILYYKDLGICRVLKKEYSNIIVAVDGVEYEADTDDLYIASGYDSAFRTYSLLTYKITTGSRFYQPKGSEYPEFDSFSPDEW